jgi:hypothetical protein
MSSARQHKYLAGRRRGGIPQRYAVG